MRKVVKIISKTFFLFIFVVSTFLFIISLSGLTNSNKVVWGNTTGTVISTHVKVSERDKGTAFCPKITYKYSIDSIEYKNESTYATAGCKLSQTGAANVLSNFTEGQTIQVFYHKDAPGNSALDDKVGWVLYFATALLLIIVLSALYCLFSSRVTNFLYHCFIKPDET